MFRDALLGLSVATAELVKAYDDTISTQHKQMLLGHAFDIGKIAEQLNLLETYGEIYTVFLLIEERYLQNKGEFVNFEAAADHYFNNGIISDDQYDTIMEIHTDMNSDEGSSDDSMFAGMFGEERLEAIFSNLKSIAEHEAVSSDDEIVTKFPQKRKPTKKLLKKPTYKENRVVREFQTIGEANNFLNSAENRKKKLLDVDDVIFVVEEKQRYILDFNGQNIGWKKLRK